jgi:hypothetical protein
MELITDNNPQIDNSLPIDSPFHSLEDRVLNLYSVEVIERNLTDLQFQYSYKICGNVSLDDKKQLSICTNKAGAQTPHEGTGRCNRHDGQLFKARSPYTRHLRQYDSLQEVFESFENREKKLNDLSEEINLGRMALSYQLSLLEKGKMGKNDMTFKNIILGLEMIRKLGGEIAKIQQAESSGITLQSVTSFLFQVSEIMNQEIPSQDMRIRVLDRIATECNFFSV